jgi:hypothetical protein
MIGIILGILGVIITIAFGIYSIWAYKKSKKGVSLEFKNEQCYSLFRDDVNRLNIEIIYNKKAFSNTLILLKAKLVNNGQIDIDKNRIFAPLKIITPQEFKWLEARPTFSPDGSTTNINVINSNEIQIDWDLLKTNEFIELEALVEITDNSKTIEDATIVLFNGIRFEYRITDLNKIQKEKIIRKISFSDKVFKKTIYFAISFILFGTIILLNEYYKPFQFIPKHVDIEYKIDNGKEKQIVKIYAYDQNKIKLEPIDSKEKIIISPMEFNTKYKIDKIEGTYYSLFYSVINQIFGYLILIGGIILLIMKLIITKMENSSSNKKNNEVGK